MNAAEVELVPRNEMNLALQLRYLQKCCIAGGRTLRLAVDRRLFFLQGVAGDNSS
jgi:hypothetical protein